MRRLIVIVAVLAFTCSANGADLKIGVAKTDVTPTTPIRLTGYAARQKESEGVLQKLYTRAMAIGTSREDASILMTLDTMAIPRDLTEEVARRLKAKVNLPRERLVICATHTHAAPCLTNAAPNIFGHPVTDAEQAHIDQYTNQLANQLEQTALAALEDLKPATLALARGSVAFAANRRKPIAPGVNGPVDHELPVLIARNPDGSIRAIVANYACHCTTGGPEINQVHGDWAGCASADLESANAGAVALISIGCGADANPSPRGSFELARQHGAEVAAEVMRLAKAKDQLKPLAELPAAQFKVIDLAYDKLPTREELEKLAQEKSAAGANAAIQLARLQRDGQLSPTIPYTVQSWTFGDDLSMVFLAGEVVVDYGLRLKNDFDPTKLWVTSYANDVLCYIPSRRVLAEGGYEAEGAMVYYARPTRFAPSVENDIIRAVHSIVPTRFRSQKSLKEFPLPKSPEESRQCIKTDGDLQVELVASEPLIESPVAIDWDLQGRLWVLEMYDYPSGLNDNNTPGGRVVVLESTKHDGHYDKRTLFLDHLSYPQGLMCWRSGVLVCAAPNILYAPDDNHDGKADRVQKLFSGFLPDNQQWEVNGLAWGLDNWVYGCSSIENDPIQIGQGDRVEQLGGRDFRMNPDTLAFEPASGRTQFCRVRDDFGNWFGNDNSTPLWHYPLEERYMRRSPNVAYPSPRHFVVADKDPMRLYPISRLLERFNSPQSANRVTSGCGPTIYRDGLLYSSSDTTEHAFFCEPVHNMVRHLLLSATGATFTGHRSPTSDAEFLASTDNWFRPVQTRTGPDGALYVVDMYRFVIEHPRWITKERLALLDTRAGFDKGRIYRVYRKGAAPRPIEDLSKGSTEELAGKMDSPNGVVRDLVHRELFCRQDRAAAAVLEKIAAQSANPAVRAQALCTLDGLHALPAAMVKSELKNGDPRVRRNALRLAEGFFKSDPSTVEAVLPLADDPDAAVRYQVALTLGEAENAAKVTSALDALAQKGGDDAWMRAAALSASAGRAAEMLGAIAHWPVNQPGRSELLSQLTRQIGAAGDLSAIAAAIDRIATESAPKASAASLALLADLLDSMDERRLARDQLPQTSRQEIEALCQRARELNQDAKATPAESAIAIRLFCRGSAKNDDYQVLTALLSDPRQAPAMHLAAVAALARAPDPAAASEVLVKSLRLASPAVRDQILGVLTSRNPMVKRLLAAIDQKTDIAPSDLPPAVRAKLLKYPNASLREHAAKSLAAFQPPQRSNALKTFAPALTLKGDATKGKILFEKTCAACHQLGGLGHPVGPDLPALTDKSSNYLLIAILDPNAAVEGRFVAYQVETTDGDTYVGLLSDETASGLTLIQPNGLKQAVTRANIKSLSSSKLSLMPEGLEQGLSPQDMADLIAFVQRP